MAARKITPLRKVHLDKKIKRFNLFWLHYVTLIPVIGYSPAQGKTSNKQAALFLMHPAARFEFALQTCNV